MVVKQDTTGDPTMGPLSEFGALRDEILYLTGAQQTIYLFQLAAAGSVLSFALTSSNRSPAAFLVPMLNYLLSVRFFAMGVAISQLGEYIRTELHPKIPGGLAWEEWMVRARRLQNRPRIAPGYMTVSAFVGPALLAWGIGAFQLVTDWTPSPRAWGMASLCGASSGFMAATIRVWQRGQEFRRQSWGPQNPRTTP